MSAMNMLHLTTAALAASSATAQTQQVNLTFTASTSDAEHLQSDNTPRVISPYLASLHLVYFYAPDRIYGPGNTTLAEWAKKNKFVTGRYPGGGTASEWDWENPTGAFPTFPHPPPSEWMSLEEYLDFCEVAGITRPTIGVNWNCHHGRKTKTMACHDWSTKFSVAKATRQAQYVVEKRGYKGAIWYIGNEDDVLSDPERWTAHALALKEVDPTMTILFNINSKNQYNAANYLKKFYPKVDKIAKKAGKANPIGGMETHYKYPEVGNWFHDHATPEMWMNQVPQRYGKDNFTCVDLVRNIRSVLKNDLHFSDTEQKNFFIANNEYAVKLHSVVSNGTAEDPNLFSRYLKALVNVEFHMDLIMAGFDQASQWDDACGVGSPETLCKQSLMDPSEGNEWRFNPVQIGHTMLSATTEMNFTGIATTNPRVFGYGARGESNGNTTMTVILLNKVDETVTVNVDFTSLNEVMLASSELDGAEVRAVSASAANFQVGEAMVDTEDGWGMRQPLEGVTCSSGLCTATLPQLSLTSLTFTL